ncbi:TIGR03000 domain-containing protein [Gemmata sp. G18]|uniref:TIGR03000 domain-containing protein n=2 Tax=Gemmata palustris TaxID=2822762 RepID=A0ABS5C239_9BACT|nr:TIGR03000 domain-containing protein [Gemmata palustris]
MKMRTFGLAVVACLVLPNIGSAQHVFLGVGVTHGYPYGPRVAPAWGYPGLYGGPFVGYPVPLRSGYGGFAGYGYGSSGFGYGYPGYYGFGYPGYFGYPGRVGSFWSNGLSLYGPPVPVYGPVPGVFGNNDLVRQWRATPGFAGYGWVGIYAASPRPRHPNVSVWPTVEQFSSGPVAVPAAKSGGCLILSVKVPQPSADVFVDGKKTAQTGTDRIFESPPLESGQAYKYTITARWLERGQTVEASREVTGTPGEVVRVDFGSGK